MTLSRLLAAALMVASALGPAQAQDARLGEGHRVLFSVTDSVKGDDGAMIQATTRLVYEPDAGQYLHTITDGNGRVLTRAVRTTSVAGPTELESRVARQLIEEHPEIAALIRDARGPVSIEGGFPLVREEGHPCGPGGRCVTLDVWEAPPTGERERLRYVIVDLRAVRVLEADASPQGDSNLAHPAARRQSRLQ